MRPSLPPFGYRRFNQVVEAGKLKCPLDLWLGLSHYEFVAELNRSIVCEDECGETRTVDKGELRQVHYDRLVGYREEALTKGCRVAEVELTHQTDKTELAFLLSKDRLEVPRAHQQPHIPRGASAKKRFLRMINAVTV